MEKKINSYYWIANNDLLYAKANLDIGKMLGNFNATVTMCSQSAEKFLKAVIECYLIEDANVLDFLHSRNLKQLGSSVKSKFNDAPLLSRELKYLGDFYYEARYPGENFTLVTDVSEALECLEIVTKIKDWVDSLPERESRVGLPRLEEFL